MLKTGSFVDLLDSLPPVISRRDIGKFLGGPSLPRPSPTPIAGARDRREAYKQGGVSPILQSSY